MKSIYSVVKIIFLVVLLASTAACQINKSQSEFYLIRHAEKQKDGTRDPKLTQEGEARAERLVEILKGKKIDKIYSTNYQRTLSTAEPLSKAKKIPIEIYDPSKLSEFSDKLKSETGIFIILGHSNTTPQLTSLLSDKKVEPMDESQYSHFYQVILKGESSLVKKLSSDKK
nr:histidine phosphatase family protein [Kangiella sp. HZ709]